MIQNAQLSDRKILVTGASGFIGSHLCKRLCNNGCVVHAVSRRKRNSENNSLEWWQADLTDIDTARELMVTIKPDLIFHLAGLPKGSRTVDLVLSTFRSNLMSTVNLLTAASEVGCDRIILSGSFEEPGLDNLLMVPSSPYAVTKWACSAYARMFHMLYHLPTVNLRIFMVYGPGQYNFSKLIPYTILSSLRGEVVKITDGHRQIDWIFVEDVIDGLLAVVQAPYLEGSTTDMGSGNLVSIRTVVQQLVNLIDPQTVILFGALPDRPMEQVGVANTTATFERIGWIPRTILEDGLKLTVYWYREKFERGELNLPNVF